MPQVAFTYAREIPKKKTNQTVLYCVESQTGTCVPVLKRFWIETGWLSWGTCPVQENLRVGGVRKGRVPVFCVRRLEAFLELGGAMRSWARPARSAHTSDASGRTRSSGHFREVTPRVPPPLTERPSLLGTLPVWPILRLPHRHAPPPARTTSPVSLSKNNSAFPRPLTRARRFVPVLEPAVPPQSSGGTFF